MTYKTEDCIIKVDTLCKTIVYLCDICRYCHNFIISKKSNYSVNDQFLRLNFIMCRYILNAFFNKSLDNFIFGYIGNYLGLNQFQGTKIKEVEYLCESIQYNNIKYKDICMDDDSNCKKTDIGENFQLEYDFQFQQNYLFYSADGKTDEEYSLCIVLLFIEDGEDA